MKVEASHSVRASREAVWDVLNEPGGLAALVPGVESIERHGQNWATRVKIPLGPGDLRLSLSSGIVEERQPEFAKLVTTGTGVGLVLRMESEIHVEPTDGGSGTSIRWEADVSLGGPNGSMGQRVLRPMVEQQVAHIFAALEQQVLQPS